MYYDRGPPEVEHYVNVYECDVVLCIDGETQYEFMSGRVAVQPLVTTDSPYSGIVSGWECILKARFLQKHSHVK